MARFKFQVPEGDMSAGDKAALAKKIGAEAKAKAEEGTVGNHEYYGGDVLNAKEVNHEAKGRELIEKGRELDRKVGEWAEKKFASFFGGLRDRATKMADHVAKAMSIGIGKGAEVASVAGRVAAEAAKVPGIAVKGGIEMGKFVGNEAKEIAEANIELAKAGYKAGKDAAFNAAVAGAAGLAEGAMWADEKGRAGMKAAKEMGARGIDAAKDAVMYDDLKEMGEGLVEAGKWAAGDESGEYIKDAVRGMGTSIAEVGKVGAELTADAARATGRGAKKVAEGAAIAGAVGVGGVALGATALGATAALGAATALGGAAAVGYGAYKGAEAIGNYGARKVQGGMEAVGNAVTTGKMKLEDAKQFVTAKASEGVSALNRAGEAGVAKLEAGKKFAQDAVGAVEQSISGLGEAAHAEVSKAKAAVESAVSQGIVSTVESVVQVKAGLEAKKAEVSEAVGRDIARVQQDVERGAARINELYDKGADEYRQFNERVTTARSAWTDFLNAGRSALESFTSIFGGKGKNKKVAEGVAKAIESQKALDSLKESGS